MTNKKMSPEELRELLKSVDKDTLAQAMHENQKEDRLSKVFNMQFSHKRNHPEILVIEIDMSKRSSEEDRTKAGFAYVASTRGSIELTEGVIMTATIYDKNDKKA